MLLDNSKKSLQRLENLAKRLQRKRQTAEHKEIIKEQIKHNIVERASEKPTGRVFYKTFIRETATTTKMRIVYNASMRPILNPVTLPLQNKLWDILVRQRAYPIAITPDIRPAFLQI